MHKLPLEKGKGESQGGQALIVVLLTMAVALTVVLSVVARSITDVSTTTFEEDSLRAFSAAEAGVEETLKKGSAPSATNIGNASYDVSTSTNSPVQNQFVYPSELYDGETATFWMASHDDSDFSLTCNSKPCLRVNKVKNICWGDNSVAAGDSDAPAIEVTILYDTNQQGVVNGDWSGLKVLKKTFDPNASRRSSNNFDEQANAGGCSLAGQNFTFSTGDIFFNTPGFNIPCWNSTGCLIATKVRMLYNGNHSHPAAINFTGNNLPAQGVDISSTGTAGESTRKVRVFNSYPELPFAFNSAVFSLKDLVK